MHNTSILVIDDEKNVRFTVAHALQAEGYDVDIAASGIEGLRKSTSKSYDLLLIDLRMPGMTGLEMLREVRRNMPEMPAVIITAYGNPQQLLEAASLGVIDSIRKPFSIQAIRSVVRNVLELSSNAEDPTPSDADGFLRRGKRALMLGRVDDAIRHLTQVQALDESSINALILLGVCQVLADDRLHAVEYFRAALAIDPSCRTASEYLLWLTGGH